MLWQILQYTKNRIKRYIYILNSEFEKKPSNMFSLLCRQDDTQGITHSDASEKTMINFTWMPPEGLKANVMFKWVN